VPKPQVAEVNENLDVEASVDLSLNEYSDYDNFTS
jgi:hypothetical protein